MSKGGELFDFPGWYTTVAQLELTVGDHRREIDIAAAFADAIDSALYLDTTAFDGGKGVGYRQATVIVHMDTQGGLGQAGAHRGHRSTHLSRQRTAVGIAENQTLGTGLESSRQGIQGIVGIGLPTVEEMLSIVELGLPVASRRKATESAIIAGLSGRPMRRASVTWKSQVLSKIQQTSAPQATSFCKLGSSRPSPWRAG